MFDPNLPPGEIEFLPFNVSRVNAAMLLDRRDDPSDPTGGWFAAANWEQAVEALGSDYGNAKLLAQQSLYRKVGGIVARRPRAGGQRLRRPGAARLRTLPARRRDDRARLRGECDRAARRRSGSRPAATHCSRSMPRCGSRCAAGSRASAFVDGGNVFRTRDEFSFRDIAVGYGSGCDWRRRSRCSASTSASRPGRSRPTAPPISSRAVAWYFGIGHIF